MKLFQELFNKLIGNLKSVKGAVYDRDARLFLGREGTAHPPFQEINDSSHCRYAVYATISGKTLPLEYGIAIAMFDESRAMAPPADCSLPCVYASGVGSHFDKPLEVLALETEGKEGVRPKWDIWMLRDINDQEGYLHDSVFQALVRK